MGLINFYLLSNQVCFYHKMSHTSIVRRKQDHNKQTWEENDFPILCESCLGDNPYLRMTKEAFGKECKTCTRPFTVFRWKPGPRARYRKTEICNVCAKLKNVCQTCILDLQFGLPTQIRDQALPNAITMPQSEANREYFMDQAETMIALSQTQREHTTPDQMLAHLSQKSPYYTKNLARVCSFFLKGTCTRGKECPYRHDNSAEQTSTSITDRYHGINDPAAKRIMDRIGKPLVPPEDPLVTTLYVGGIKAGITEQDLRSEFSPFGELQSVCIVPKLESAFVTFETREGAESAASALHKNLKINGRILSLGWGKSQNALPPALPAGGQPSALPGAPGLFAMMPSLGSMFASPGQAYPSMDPTAMGTQGDIATTTAKKTEEIDE